MLNAHLGNPLSKRPRHQEEVCTREIRGPLCFLQNKTKLKQKQKQKNETEVKALVGDT